jgi:hypothetical protein
MVSKPSALNPHWLGQLHWNMLAGPRRAKLSVGATKQARRNGTNRQLQLIVEAFPRAGPTSRDQPPSLWHVRGAGWDEEQWLQLEVLPQLPDFRTNITYSTLRITLHF